MMEESFDLFRMRLDLMVRPGHPLEVLGTRIRWDEIENNLGTCFNASRSRCGKWNWRGCSESIV